MNRLLREPLLHFVLLGALLFGVHRVLNPEPGVDPEKIVVSSGQIEHLITAFARTWQRPPSEEEIRGLVDQHVREEILSREAVKLGLDQNDVIIRRRLHQKMEFVAEDLAALAEPTDADLEAYLASHPDMFRRDATYTFRQVFLSEAKRGDSLDADAGRMLEDLKRRGGGADTTELGDTSLLPPGMEGESRRGVEGVFGREFAAALAALPAREWSGPVRSGFGLHLVWLERAEGGRVPGLDEARDEVRREWHNARREEANRRYFEELLKRYEVSVQWPGKDLASMN